MPHIVVPTPSVGIAESPFVPINRKTPQDYGSAAWQDVGKVGNQIIDIAKQQQDKMNVAAVQQGVSQLYDFQDQALYGQDGLYSVKGANAMGKTDSIMKAYQDKVDAVTKTLKNKNQIAGFQQQALSMRDSIKRRATAYEFQQNQDYQNEQHQAIIKQATNAAVSGYNIQGETDKQLGQLDQTIVLNGQLNGEPPEQTNLRIRQARSNVYTGVVNQMITDGNYQGAKDYYNAHKTEFYGADVATVENSVKHGTLLGDTQAQSDAIISKNLPETDALNLARQIKDPDVRAATVRSVSVRYSQNQAALKQQQTQNFNTAAQQVEQTKDIKQINPTLWNSLSPTQKNQLTTRAETLQKGIPVVTDKSTYNKLSLEQPSQLLKENMMDYRNKLSDADWKHFVNMQNDLVSKKNSGSSIYSSTLSFNQMALLNAQKIGMVPQTGTSTTWSNTESQNFHEYLQAASQAIIDYETDTGKKATQQDKERIVNDLALNKVQVPNGGFFSWGSKTEFPFQVQQNEKGQVYVDYDNIKPDTLASIQNLLRSNNKPLSKDLIQQIAGAYAMGDRARVMQLAGEK